MRLSLLLRVFTLQWVGSQGFGRGAPGDVDKTRVTVCEELTPWHFNATEQPHSTIPFSLTTSLPFCLGGRLVVRVRVTSETTLLMGFVMQARDLEDHALGTFDPSYTPNTTLTCQGSTLTQSRKQWKNSLEMMWLVPDGFEGGVKIMANLLSNVTLFWRVSSKEITIDQQKQICGCSGLGSFTCADDSCGVEWWKNGTNIHFRLDRVVTEPANYIAVGFSQDYKMGNDLVIYCYYDEDDKSVKLNVGMTQGHTFTPIDREPDDVTLVSGSLSANHLSCHFSTAFAFPNEPSVDPFKNEYVLLVASGVQNEGNIHKHTAVSMSDSPIDFSSVSCTTVESAATRNKNLLKSHGVMMIVAWMLIATFSIVLPRYFKNSTISPAIHSQPFWFFFHRGGMAATMIITIIAFIIIFIYVGAYSPATGWSALHPILGIVTTILVITNPIMALFRCSPSHPQRWVFNRLHQIVGVTALYIALLNLLLASTMESITLPPWWIWVVVTHILWFTIFDLSLFIYGKFISKGNATAEQIELRDERTSITARSKVQEYGPSLLILHLLVILVLSIAAISGVLVAI